MQNEQSTKVGTFHFYLEKGKICLEFSQFNGLYKSHEAIENFIKQIKKEVIKFKKWKQYQDELTAKQFAIEMADELDSNGNIKP